MEKIGQDFTGLHVSEGLMAALVSLNLLESAVKRKLDLLDVEYSTKLTFGELYELLRMNLLTKEGRRLRQHLFSA